MILNKGKWKGKKTLVILILAIVPNILFFVYKDAILYGYLFYSRDYTEDKKRISLSGEIRSLELNDYYMVIKGEPDVKYFVYGSLSAFQNGVILIESITFDKNSLIRKLRSQHYIKDIYATNNCSVFKFIKPFEGVDYSYLASLEGIQAVISFNSSDKKGSRVSEICNIFKHLDS